MNTFKLIAIITILGFIFIMLLSPAMSMISRLYYLLLGALGGIFAKPTWEQFSAPGQPPFSLPFPYFLTCAAMLDYIGADAASPTMIERLLWPSRFYNTHSLLSTAKFALLIANEFHFSAHDLLGGSTWGKMLGTAFFSDTGKKYKDYSTSTRNDPLEWGQNPAVVLNAEERSRSRPVRAIRPVFHLSLTFSKPKSGQLKASVPTVNGDTGVLQWRTVLGLCASESTALATSLFVALHWHTPLALWFCVPLTLKLLSLATSVRREPFMNLDNYLENTAYEITDMSKGFMVITGLELLVEQCFSRYGSPQRDRIREVACMVLVAASMLLFPAGVLLFARASQDLQWVWLGYQSNVVLAMLLYRACGGDSIGTTEEQLAQALDEKKAVSLVVGEGNGVTARLTTVLVNSVACGREEVERLVNCYGWEDGGD